MILMTTPRKSHGKDIKLTSMTQLWPNYGPIMTWSGISRPPLGSCQGGRVQHLVVDRVIIKYYHHESEMEPFLYSSFMIINSIIYFNFFYGQTEPWQKVNLFCTSSSLVRGKDHGTKPADQNGAINKITNMIIMINMTTIIIIIMNNHHDHHEKHDDNHNNHIWLCIRREHIHVITTETIYDCPSCFCRCDIVTVQQTCSKKLLKRTREAFMQEKGRSF